MLLTHPTKPGQYNVLVLRRGRYGGYFLVPGCVVHFDHLRHALHLCAIGMAVPADPVTKLDVELGLLLRRAIDAKKAAACT
jgi:hypothetical protein